MHARHAPCSTTSNSTSQFRGLTPLTGTTGLVFAG
jgi:hypothetical protein